MSINPIKCKTCGVLQDISCFSPNGRYRHRRCTTCRGTNDQEAKLLERNRVVAKLINWRIVAVLVVGIFSHEVSDGLTRTCFYSSVYGLHAMTISVTSMCPITWEFEL